MKLPIKLVRSLPTSWSLMFFTMLVAINARAQEGAFVIVGEHYRDVSAVLEDIGTGSLVYKDEKSRRITRDPRICAGDIPIKDFKLRLNPFERIPGHNFLGGKGSDAALRESLHQKLEFTI